MKIQPIINELFLQFKITRLMFFLGCLWTVLLCSPTWADPQRSNLEGQLIESMSLDFRTGERKLASGVVIRALISHGYVHRKPEMRIDYTDHRVLRRDISVFGFVVVVLEEEYMGKYVGCCVSPGVALIVEGNGNMNALLSFAKRNKCSVDDRFDINEISAHLKLKELKTTYISISCRDRDKN